MPECDHRWRGIIVEPGLVYDYRECVLCGDRVLQFPRNQPWNQRGDDERTRSSKHPLRAGKPHKNRRRGRQQTFDDLPRSSGVRTYFVDPETLK